MARIGYARCSSRDQNLDRQLDALRAAGCDKIFEEKRSGKNRDRPALVELLGYMREGDTVMVTELSRLGRSMRDLLTLVEEMRAGKVEFRSLKEAIDTTTPAGKLIFHVLAALAEFQRDVILENAAEGRASAKARGETGGRPHVAAAKLSLARQLAQTGTLSLTKIAQTVGVGRATLTRHGIAVAVAEAA